MKARTKRNLGIGLLVFIFYSASVIGLSSELHNVFKGLWITSVIFAGILLAIFLLWYIFKLINEQ
jgi:hypothetical protein